MRKIIIRVFIIFAVAFASTFSAEMKKEKKNVTANEAAVYMSRAPRFVAYRGGTYSSVPVSDELMERVRAMAEAHVPCIDIADLGIHVPPDQISGFAGNISSAIMPRYPELICLDQLAGVSADADGDTGLVRRVSVFYTIRKKTDKKEQKQLRKAVRKIARKARKKKGKAAQVRYVNSVLKKRVTYSMKMRHCYDAYGALIQRRAVCSGYACAFALIMNELGIDNAFERKDTHIWNRVRIGRAWKVVDVTWNDTTHSNDYLLTDVHGE